MKIECYAASLTQEGRKINEDAWLILRGDPLGAALCDGAGDARKAMIRERRKTLPGVKGGLWMGSVFIGRFTLLIDHLSSGTVRRAPCTLYR